MQCLKRAKSAKEKIKIVFVRSHGLRSVRFNFLKNYQIDKNESMYSTSLSWMYFSKILENVPITLIGL